MSTEDEKKTTDNTAELKEAFGIFDKDSDGTITVNELGDILMQFGHVFTKPDLKKVIDLYDKNGDGEIDFEEFNALMQSSVDKMSPEDEINAAFDVFDKDGDGSITADEIAAVMEQLGEKVDKETITFMIEAVDDNSDGTIDKAEFRKMLMDGPA